MGKRRNRLTQLFIPLFGVFVVLYTTHQAFSGERGFFSWYKLQQQVEQLQRQNVALAEQVARMEAQVSRMNLKTPDLDYLEEQIRKTLPVAKENERIIYIKPVSYNS